MDSRSLTSQTNLVAEAFNSVTDPFEESKARELDLKDQRT